MVSCHEYKETVIYIIIFLIFALGLSLSWKTDSKMREWSWQLAHHSPSPAGLILGQSEEKKTCTFSSW